ncbi:MAG: chromosomal replication initiator protein DnaA [Nitrospirota bacterium]
MKNSNIWDTCLGIIEQKVSKQPFDMWFPPTHLRSLTEKEACIEVPNRFFKEWFEEHYIQLISDVLKTALNKDELNVTIIISTENKKDTDKQRENEAKTLKQRERGIYLNPKYTFNTFVVGTCNQFAHASARAVAGAPAIAYNPLFIYGGVGLGKTHLMNAIGNFIWEKNLTIKLVYTPAEQFTNELITSLRYGRMVEFRNKYRNMEVLLIDDIQFIAGKNSTQEEFFHTFNTLYEYQKQIVISSDRFPKDINQIDDRLKSRFEWGLIADIQPPDVETRVAILLKKASSEGIVISLEVAQFIADRIKTNIRELEGSLIRLGAHASFTKKAITIDFAKSVLKDIFDEKERLITVDLIQKQVADYFEIRLADLRSKKRTKEIATARQIAMYLSKNLTTLSLSEIGKNIGGKNHATVIHACKQIEDKKAKDENLQAKIDALMGLIKGE